MNNPKEKGLKPFQLLTIGYIGITLVTAFLLMLPFAAKTPGDETMLDIFFAAFAAVSTSGLTAVDTASHYTLFGQIVILCVIQLCGIGYMFFISLALLGAFGKVSLESKMILKETMNTSSLSDTTRLLRAAIVFTLVFEAAGAVVLFFVWVGEYGPAEAAYHAVFHSVSAFATAGYSSFEGGIARYAGNPLVTTVISALSIAGGIGFVVLYNLKHFFLPKRGESRLLTTHTKFVLCMTAVVIFSGTVLYYLSEAEFSGFGIKAASEAFFQAMAASTTVGFSTVNLSGLSETTLFILALLMFIGASPGSTGGGIKTTTFGIVAAFTYCNLKERAEINIMKREIRAETAKKAVSIMMISMFIVFISAFILSFLEQNVGFFKLLVESVAAFSAGGLSAGITSSLTPASKVLLMATMFAGRVGPITLGLLMSGSGKESKIKYPDAGVMVG